MKASGQAFDYGTAPYNVSLVEEIASLLLNFTSDK